MNKAFVFIPGGLLVIDQWIKSLVFGKFVCNYGAAFGFRIPFLFIALLTAVLFGYILILWKKGALLKEKKALVYIFFGAVSNIVDRFAYGCVVDYIQVVDFFPYFNIADIMISFGGAWYMYHVVVDNDKM